MTDIEPPRRPRGRWIKGGVATAVVLVVIAGILVVQARANQQAAIEEAARAASERFATGWAADDFAGVDFADQTATEVTDDYRRLTDGLGEFAVTIRSGATEVIDDRATTAYVVEWTLVGRVRWTTDARIELERTNDTWQVVWSPAVVHPDLSPTTRLVAERTVPTRGPILGLDGGGIVVDRPVVVVGVQPSRVEDLQGLAATLAATIGVSAEDVVRRVEAAPPDAFVEVITLRREEYEPISAQIQPLPGTVFRERELPLAPSRTFARGLLGTSGEVTAEIVDRSNGRYRAGDVAGLSGMQARYDEVLRGSTGVKVFVTNAPLPGEPAIDDPEVALRLDPVFDTPAVAGRPVRTTIDPDVQFAADAALADTTAPSSLVVIRPSTGEVLAVANGPGGGDTNLAFTGQYPPGSVFKVVSTQALLDNRLSIGETVDCPAELDVDGRTFTNAENEVLGKVPFRQAFAHSCNTAFVGLSERLGDEALPAAGARFGLGGSWSPGVPAFTGTVPAAEGATDRAAATFGQGRILVSPLSMAMVAATVADGTWHAPVVVREPADPGADSNAASDSAPEPLPPTQIENLRTLMAEAVSEGTGRALQLAPGDPVSGKTGTAEFGTDDPPRSHAWFIGYQGDLAFAVFVEGGEFGGYTAAPIATDLLTRLAARPGE